MEYLPNGGQTYLPIQENTHVPTLPFTPLSSPSPAYPVLELTAEAQDKGYVITSQAQHFLPGVTAKMLDWWWANMEKGYYLWAPGSHKRFSWVKSPGQYGFLNSAHRISEAMVPGKPVFGGSGIQINRLDLSCSSSRLIWSILSWRACLIAKANSWTPLYICGPMLLAAATISPQAWPTPAALSRQPLCWRTPPQLPRPRMARPMRSMKPPAGRYSSPPSTDSGRDTRIPAKISPAT